MPEIIRRNKPLSVNPLKTSQTIGAALAFAGFQRAIPMLHGSQGCAAFGKVFFVGHFQEPIPLQTTAMDQVSTIMGSQESIVDGLKSIAEKHRPALIGLPTTGLTETQGSDVERALKDFGEKYPEFDDICIAPVATPDYAGCLESGFAAAVRAIIEAGVPGAKLAGTSPGRQYYQLNVLAGSALTPGDIEELKTIIEAFGLMPVVVPDLSDSLDGHLMEGDFSALTIGGASVPQLQTLGNALATLVIGRSLKKAADELRRRTGVLDYRFDHLMGLDATDALIGTLQQIANRAVPKKIERQRAQLQDAMLDCHFALGMARVAVAADPDLLVGLSQMVTGVGAEVVAAVSPINTSTLGQVAADKVKIGDLEDLEEMSRAGGAEILITNSHGAETARRLGIPLLRAGFPQHDLLGGYQKTWIGYRGTRQTLFDLANLVLTLEKGHIPPYRSIHAQRPEDARGEIRPMAA
uniref:Nitrogenase iron-molybdenum cofactor biosynthesis protein NifN n=1 Tax=Candidatus Kentrum sp. FW TaxID=2126338 RepID=A0A450THN6_9GAMM|nr:MAG: nitrogenase molybdenum-iron protein NifN [Candidatus Kentron sp. FW]